VMSKVFWIRLILGIVLAGVLIGPTARADEQGAAQVMAVLKGQVDTADLLAADLRTAKRSLTMTKTAYERQHRRRLKVQAEIKVIVAEGKRYQAARKRHNRDAARQRQEASRCPLKFDPRKYPWCAANYQRLNAWAERIARNKNRLKRWRGNLRSKVANWKSRALNATKIERRLLNQYQMAFSRFKLRRGKLAQPVARIMSLVLRVKAQMNKCRHMPTREEAHQCLQAYWDLAQYINLIVLPKVREFDRLTGEA
ncbi:MAG: hypothetical protein KJ621_04410, partial [Proteobacteria bacterium]|nr:hypothetical protein [Pseudomonadota bacterium]